MAAAMHCGRVRYACTSHMAMATWAQRPQTAAGLACVAGPKGLFDAGWLEAATGHTRKGEAGLVSPWGSPSCDQGKGYRHQTPCLPHSALITFILAV